MKKSLFILPLFLVPQSVSAQLAACVGSDCSFCTLVVSADRVVDLFVVIMVGVTVLLLGWAGFKFVIAVGNTSAMVDAKNMLTNVLIGFVLILAAWTIVDTIMKVSISSNAGLGVWHDISEENCGIQLAAQEPAVTSLEDFVDRGGLFDPIDEEAIAAFTSDHGYGVDGTVTPITGVGANCPGASAADVVPIPGEENFKLRPQSANNYVAMREAAAADGITLRVTSAWRSQATQEEIWERRNCDVVDCSGGVARPCSKGGNGSNHNGGVAVDIAGSYRGSAIYNWLKANGGRYSFYNNLPPRDPVHWSPSGR